MAASSNEPVVIGAREFNQDVSAAKHAARCALVTITERGEPKYVLLNIADYRKITGQGSIHAFIESL